MLMEDILFDAIDYGSGELAVDDSAIMHEFDNSLAEKSTPANTKSLSEDNYSGYQQFQDREWLPEDDELLIKLVQELGPHGKWKEICTRLHRWDEKDCESRYYFRKSLLKGFNFWTEAEEDLLRSLIARYDGGKPNWKVISSQIPTRTTAAIKTHWRAIQKRDMQQRPPESTGSLRRNNALEYSNALQPEQSQMYQSPEYLHNLTYDHYFIEQKMMYAQITRCSSEDSHVTYIPDADQNFGRCDHYDDMDTRDIIYPSSKRVRSDDCINEFSSQWQCATRESMPLSFLPGGIHVPTMTTSCQTHSTDISPSSSFVFHTTHSSDHCESFGPISHESNCFNDFGSSLKLSTNPSLASTSVDNTEEDDFVTTFIETFGNMEDEDTRSYPPASFSAHQSIDTMLPTTNREFFNDETKEEEGNTSTAFENNAIESINEFPKRAITSWENAIKALPLRKEKRSPSKIVIETHARESTTSKTSLNEQMDNETCIKKPGKRRHPIKPGKRSQLCHNDISLSSYDQTANCLMEGGSNQYNGKHPTNPNNLSMDVPNKLVYVPCVYANTPNHTMAYTTSHPSMQGLRRPPPGFRLIQAPALVSPRMLPFVPHVPAQLCHHPLHSHGSMLPNTHSSEEYPTAATNPRISSSMNIFFNDVDRATNQVDIEP